MTPYSLATKIAKLAVSVGNRKDEKYFQSDAYRFRQMAELKARKEALSLTYEDMDSFVDWFYAQVASDKFLPWRATTLFTEERLRRFRQWEKSHSHETRQAALSRPRRGSVSTVELARIVRLLRR